MIDVGAMGIAMGMWFSVEVQVHEFATRGARSRAGRAFIR